jgi:hypothetical protein
MKIVRNISRVQGEAEKSVDVFWGKIRQSGSEDDRRVFLRIANEIVRLERVQYDMEFGVPVSRHELIEIGRSPSCRRLEVPSAFKALCGESLSLIDLHQILTAIAPACWEIILTEYWQGFAANGASARLQIMKFGEAVIDLAEDEDGVARRTLLICLEAAIRPLTRVPPAVQGLVDHDVTDVQRRHCAIIMAPTIERLLLETGHIRQTMPPPPPGGTDDDPSSSDAIDGPTSIRLVSSLAGLPFGSAVG